MINNKKKKKELTKSNPKEKKERSKNVKKVKIRTKEKRVRPLRMTNQREVSVTCPWNCLTSASTKGR